MNWGAVIRVAAGIAAAIQIVSVPGWQPFASGVIGWFIADSFFDLTHRPARVNR
jgi:type IV secretory pathway TrbD component